MSSVTLHFAFAICLSAIVGCNPSLQYMRTVAEDPRNDADSVIALALSRAVVTRCDVPDYKLLRKSPSIVLVTTTTFVNNCSDTVDTVIGPTALPHSGSVKFSLLSPEQIQNLADERGDFVYLGVPSVHFCREEIVVAVSTNWAISRNRVDKIIIMSGGGYYLRFLMVNGSWTFDRVLSMWIS